MAGKKGMKWEKVKEPRNIRKGIRFSKSEYEEVQEGFKESNKKTEMDYMRDKILDNE